MGCSTGLCAGAGCSRSISPPSSCVLCGYLRAGAAFPIHAPLGRSGPKGSSFSHFLLPVSYKDDTLMPSCCELLKAQLSLQRHQPWELPVTKPPSCPTPCRVTSDLARSKY